MSISAQTLIQARESLTAIDRERQFLVCQVRDQGRKIVELETEVQRQANLLSYTQQLLADVRRECDALRSQLPDAATLEAYEALQQYLTRPEHVRKDSPKIAA